MWQDIVPSLTKQSYDILPNNTRIVGQPSPNCPNPCHLQHCLPLPQVLRMCHPIRSLSQCTPSACCTQMTLAAFQAEHAWETNTSWLPSMPMAISSSSKHSNQRATAIALPPIMPSWCAWQPGVFQLTSRSSTTRPTWHTKKPSPWNAKFQLVPPDMHYQNWACRRPLILHTVQGYFWACLTKVRHYTCDEARPLSQVWGVEPNTSLGYEVAEPPHHHHIIAWMQDCIPI